MDERPKHTRAIDVSASRWEVSFFHPGDEEAFSAIGDFGIGMQFADMLKALGHHVRVYVERPDVFDAVQSLGFEVEYSP